MAPKAIKIFTAKPFIDKVWTIALKQKEQQMQKTWDRNQFNESKT